jgi:hypothetical protein
MRFMTAIGERPVLINPDIAVEGKIELQKKRKANKNAPFR